jgi:hypothetical protein
MTAHTWLARKHTSRNRDWLGRTFILWVLFALPLRAAQAETPSMTVPLELENLGEPSIRITGLPESLEAGTTYNFVMTVPDRVEWTAVGTQLVRRDASCPWSGTSSPSGSVTAGSPAVDAPLPVSITLTAATNGFRSVSFTLPAQNAPNWNRCLYFQFYGIAEQSPTEDQLLTLLHTIANSPSVGNEDLDLYADLCDRQSTPVIAIPSEVNRACREARSQEARRLQQLDALHSALVKLRTRLEEAGSTVNKNWIASHLVITINDVRNSVGANSGVLAFSQPDVKAALLEVLLAFDSTFGSFKIHRFEVLGEFSASTAARIATIGAYRNRYFSLTGGVGALVNDAGAEPFTHVGLSISIVGRNPDTAFSQEYRPRGLSNRAWRTYRRLSRATFLLGLTLNTPSWPSSDGVAVRGAFGDNYPMVGVGYRFSDFTSIHAGTAFVSRSGLSEQLLLAGFVTVTLDFPLWDLLRQSVFP